jgi:hypothetical protein
VIARSAIDFYEGAATDHRGRTLPEILNWPDDRLEDVHDFIQWLFPLPEPSPVNPAAPLLTPDAIAAFHLRAELRDRLRASLERMLRFYGFALQNGPKVVPAENFRRRAANWLRPFNHNHLRITRILKCCALVGLDAEAHALLACLEDLAAQERAKSHAAISPESLRFWRDAVA